MHLMSFDKFATILDDLSYDGAVDTTKSSVKNLWPKGKSMKS